MKLSTLFFACSALSFLAGSAVQLFQGLQDDTFDGIVTTKLDESMPDPDFDHLCDDRNMLMITADQLLYTNMDGKDSRYPRGIRISNVFPHSGQYVDMVFNPTTLYPKDADRANDISHFVQRIGVNPGGTIGVEVQFRNRLTDQPVVVPDFALTIGDLDNQDDGQAVESVAVTGHDTYSMTEKTSTIQVRQLSPTTTEFYSALAGDDGSGIRYPMSMTELERSKAVMLTFSGVSGFNMTLSLGQSWTTRVFLFTGASALVCPRRQLCQEWTCPEFHVPRMIPDGDRTWCHASQCSEAGGDAALCCSPQVPDVCKRHHRLVLDAGRQRSSNLGGYGPDEDAPEGIFWTNVLPHSGLDVDLRVSARSTYTSVHPERNKAESDSKHDFGTIDVAVGSRVDLRFDFFQLHGEKPFEIPFPVMFSVFDLGVDSLVDETSPTGIQEVMIAQGYSDYFLTNETVLKKSRFDENMHPTFTATALLERHFDAEDAVNLTKEKLDSTVSYSFDGPFTGFDVTFVVQGDETSLKSMAFSFGGTSGVGCPKAAQCSSLECPAGYVHVEHADTLLCAGPKCEFHETEVCCVQEAHGLCSQERTLTMVEGTEMVNNLGGLGPQEHWEQNIVVSNVFRYEKHPVDMVVSVVNLNIVGSKYSTLRIVFTSVWGGGDMNNTDDGGALQFGDFSFYHCGKRSSSKPISVLCENCKYETHGASYSYTGENPTHISLVLEFAHAERFDGLSFETAGLLDSDPRHFQVFGKKISPQTGEEDWELIMDYYDRDFPQTEQRGVETAYAMTIVPVGKCDGGYTPFDTSQNGVEGGFLKINVATETTVDLNFAFVDRDTGKPFTPKPFYWTIADIDHGPKGQEFVTASGFFNYTIIGDRTVLAIDGQHKHTAFTSKRLGNETDDPGLPESMTEEQAAKSVSLLYVDRNNFSLTLAVDHSNYPGGTNFLFAGASSQVCPKSPDTCGSFVCTGAYALRTDAEVITCRGRACETGECCVLVRDECDSKQIMVVGPNSVVRATPNADEPDAGALRIVYGNVFPNSGRNLMLVVENKSAYTPPPVATFNYTRGSFGSIPMMPGTHVNLSFRIIDTETNQLATDMSGFLFTAVDLDHRNQGYGTKHIEVPEYFGKPLLSDHSFVTLVGARKFSGGKYYTNVSVSGHPLAMPANKRHRSVSFDVSQSEWWMIAKTGNTDIDSSIEFAGVSNVVCEPKATCDTMECPEEWIHKEGAETIVCAGGQCTLADRNTCCKTMLCEPQRSLNFETVRYSNLGRMGPDLDMPPILRYSDVFPSLGDEAIDLEVQLNAPEGEAHYYTKDSVRNGHFGVFASIDLLSGSKVNLTFTFRRREDSHKIQVPPFLFTYLDLDANEEGRGEQSIIMSGHAWYKVTPTTSMKTSNVCCCDGIDPESAPVAVVPRPKPQLAEFSGHPLALTRTQLDRTISFHMPALEEFNMSLMAGPGYRGVRFLFAGATNLVCDREFLR